MTVDTCGNIYVTGGTYGSLDGQPYAGTSDLFLVQYNAAGAKQWTRQLGTARSEWAWGVAADVSGNIYVTGETHGGLDGNTNAGGMDAFLVKYSATGSKQWTLQFGTPENEEGRAVLVDGSGNIYVAGWTSGGLDGNINAGSTDLFLVKYDAAGKKQWTRQLGTPANEFAYGAAVDASGNIYVTGETYGGLDGNPNVGRRDIFLVKYDGAGNKQWTRQLGTPVDEFAIGVAADPSGNAYVTGLTYGGLDGNTNAGFVDVFLVKYDAAGNKQWTRQLGTPAADVGWGVAVDASGNVYVTGLTEGNLDGQANAGYRDTFLVKYDATGQKQWTRLLGTAALDEGNAVAVDSDGNIYVTGLTLGSLDGNRNAGYGDVFLVKYNDAGVKQ